MKLVSELNNFPPFIVQKLHRTTNKTHFSVDETFDISSLHQDLNKLFLLGELCLFVLKIFFLPFQNIPMI